VAFRTAVMAQVLWREVPLSLALAGGHGRAVRDFVRSGAFEASLREGSAPGPAFARWVQVQARSARDEAASLVGALESWARALRPARPLAPGPGEVGMAPGVAVGRFPGDVAEVVHAASSLKRHVQGRAGAGDEGVDATAFEGLRQAARRAGPGSTWVAVRQGPSGLQLAALGDEEGRLLKALESAPQPEGELPAWAWRLVARGLVARG
jgi:uncharacterized protein